MILVESPVVEEQADHHGLKHTCHFTDRNSVHRAILGEDLRDELIDVSKLDAVSWISFHVRLVQS